jgi:hypothetical protein
MKVRVPGGWKIRNHKTGSLWPKLYKTEAEVDKRLNELERHK